MSTGTLLAAAARAWPKGTRDVLRLLDIPETKARYLLRTERIDDARRPALVNGRLLWWPASVLALVDTLLRHRVSGFAGLSEEMRTQLEAAAARHGQ